VLSEGWDEPSLECIVIATPTRSQVKYAQIAGRGLRTYPGKTDCLIIDVVGVTDRHDLQTLPDHTTVCRKIRRRSGTFLCPAWLSSTPVAHTSASARQAATSPRRRPLAIGAKAPSFVEKEHSVRGDATLRSDLSSGTSNCATSASSRTAMPFAGSSTRLM
jgi:type I site-specific restriction endonuclease